MREKLRNFRVGSFFQNNFQLGGKNQDAKNIVGKYQSSKYSYRSVKFSFAPKYERKYFCISALAYKKRSNQKSRERESK